MEVGTSVDYRSSERKTEEHKTGQALEWALEFREGYLPQLGKACV